MRIDNPSIFYNKEPNINTNSRGIMKIFDYRSKAAEKRIKAISGRCFDFRKKDITAVTRIVEDVKRNGDKALMGYVNRFDSPTLTVKALKVTEKEMDAAKKEVDRSFIRALNRAISQIRSFHTKQVEQSWIDTSRSGTLLGQLVNPIDTAGVYVPGGKGGTTPLVSSVLMGTIPARVAGVKNVFMATPSTKAGTVNPHLLVAAKRVGVDAVYKVGSAWAIAALAFGTETIPGVDVIVGPGNIYVTLAKKIVSGNVGIDMVAGPSEILVIADAWANPEYLAADLLSQAEHDPLAASVLITDSPETASAVATAVDRQLHHLSRREIAAASLDQYGAILVVSDLMEAVAAANRIAPEHLELIVKDPFEYVGLIRHAGAVFLGESTPEPVGDYIAGPNHVLPTAGTARFSSALSVETFTKKTSLIQYSAKALARDAKEIITLAETEGLDAHANAIRVRFDGKL
jgi:histidinol dehydrogenase